MENIFGKYNSIFQKRIDDKLKDFHTPQIDILNSPYNIADSKGHYLFQLDNILYKFFECNNGYIGFDLLVIYKNTYNLMFWYYILTESITEEEEKKTSKVELQISFYQWVNAIYNLKEKILFLVGCKYSVKKSDFVFTESCLNTDGQKRFRELINKGVYKEIFALLNIRNLIVHNTYDLDFDENTNNLLLRKFDFTIRKEHDKRKFKNKAIELNDEWISQIYNLLIDLIDDYKRFLVEVDNIDLELLNNKYRLKDGSLLYKFTL